MSFFDVLVLIFKVIVSFAIIMVGAAYSTYFERKILGWMHSRRGPMHVGPRGILQPLADFIKLFFQEDIVPAAADQFIFKAAPIVALFPAVLVWAGIPLGEKLIVADLDIGIIFALGISSLSVQGVIMAGWGSNSKYALFGGIRTVAQVISYEVAIGFSVIGVVLWAGSMNLATIVEAQNGIGFFFVQPLGCLIFLLCGIAESARTPFDIPEAESEIVAGFFVEYSGLRFAFFALTEYLHMLAIATLGVLMFFGGWKIGNLPIPAHLNFLVVVFKVAALVYVFSWIRATLPRYRYDQLMNLGWKILLPLSLFNVAITGLAALIPKL